MYFYTELNNQVGQGRFFANSSPKTGCVTSS